ncbi:ribonuclease H [Georhizobium sp. MAB10]|uniref:ribonuclease H family protein n=1 Tax=Georhizobium sp. MAB10 TaxID=3028319 RepID=UPI0038560229
MTYRIPDTLPALTKFVRKHSLQFSTERQAAFMIQQIAQTRLKFPPKGESCFPLLLKLEKALADQAESLPLAPAPKVVARPKQKGKKPDRAKVVVSPAIDLNVGLVIFCDGGCEPNPGAGGWGFAVYRDGVEIHSAYGGDVQATNNTMEITAALMALRWFADRGVVEPVRVLCDSQYVVRGCNEWRHKWKKNGWSRRGPNSTKPEAGVVANLGLWKELDEALALVPITLEWVRGHIGTVGNERADELASIGREDALAALQSDPIAQQLRCEVS